MFRHKQKHQIPPPTPIGAPSPTGEGKGKTIAIHNFLPLPWGEGGREAVGRGVLLSLLTFLISACSPAPDMLIDPANIEGDALPAPLTQTPGDTERGRAVFTNRDKGHCILCHQVTPLPDEFQGNIGPALDGVADRLSPAQIRLRLVDYERVKPGTLMPSYYRTARFHQVQDVYKDKPILTAQEIEDVVAYLATLTEDE